MTLVTQKASLGVVLALVTVWVAFGLGAISPRTAFHLCGPLTALWGVIIGLNAPRSAQNPIIGTGLAMGAIEWLTGWMV